MSDPERAAMTRAADVLHRSYGGSAVRVRRAARDARRILRAALDGMPAPETESERNHNAAATELDHAAIAEVYCRVEDVPTDLARATWPTVGCDACGKVIPRSEARSVVNATCTDGLFCADCMSEIGRGIEAGEAEARET